MFPISLVYIVPKFTQAHNVISIAVYDRETIFNFYWKYKIYLVGKQIAYILQAKFTSDEFQFFYRSKIEMIEWIYINILNIVLSIDFSFLINDRI